MLINFYLEENLQTGKTIIDQTLAGDTSKFITNFQQIVFEQPDANDRSAMTRYNRVVLCYRALLRKAGLQSPPNLLPQVRGLFGADLRTALTGSQGTRAAEHQQAAILLANPNISWDQMAQACEYLNDFINDKSSGYATFNQTYMNRPNGSGEAWADDNLKKILEMFKYPQ